MNAASKAMFMPYRIDSDSCSQHIGVFPKGFSLTSVQFFTINRKLLMLLILASKVLQKQKITSNEP